MNQLKCAVFHLTRVCQLWPKTILKVRGASSHRKIERDLPLPLAAAGDLGEEPKTRGDVMNAGARVGRGSERREAPSHRSFLVIILARSWSSELVA